MEEILLSLCLRLEKRMVEANVFCKTIGIFIRYDGSDYFDKKGGYSDTINMSIPMQDGAEILNTLKKRIKQVEEMNTCERIINEESISLSLYVGNFVNEELVQYGMFEDNSKKDKLRKTVYSLKDKFGTTKLIRGAELNEESDVRDVIGFGSIKDLNSKAY
jgi:DNA polymerase-4